MKTIFKLALAAMILFTFSCSPDTVLESQENLEAVNAKAKKAKKATRAWRGKFSNVADLTQSIVACEPVSEGVVLTTNVISGNMTHLGKIQEGSFGRPQDGTCFLTGPNSVRVIYNVNYIGAHGDQITTEEDVTIILDFDADPNGFVGTFENTKDGNGNPIPIKIIDGTGRFEGATGELLFKDASFGPSASGDGTVISTWRLIGEITY
ncbi:MAG: hypothetical protein KJN96_07805 [Eudoraea sp.]|nr:hypothetical protein [Eudoraea sp.]MBT8223058.1 hypothetical protein [Eudoraea sp.]NNJ40347.1 hypothetical protein [Eudoraea sp.]